MSLKIWKNKKGLSPVLGHILMLMIVVISSTFLFAYAANFISDYQRGRGATMMQRLLFEDVWFKSGGIRITIYNYGEISTKVIGVFIDGADYAINDPAQGYVTIMVGEHEFVEVNFAWNSGENYHMKLLTERGSTFVGDFSAP